MRRSIWGLRQWIIILFVAQAVVALGLVLTWWDANRQGAETRRLLDERIKSEDTQIEELTKHVGELTNHMRNQLHTMSLIKNRQDELNRLIRGQEPEAIIRPVQPTFKPPRSGRPN